VAVPDPQSKTIESNKESLQTEKTQMGGKIEQENQIEV